MRAPSFRWPTIIPLALLAGCAGSVASYPSLAPRPIEQATDGAAPPTPPAVAALDPAVIARAAALVAAARGGAAALDGAAKAGCAAIGRGFGAAEGSETWVAAQQALSAIEAERTPTASALDDLDALVLEQARLAQDAATPVDLSPLTDAAREVGALDEAQRARLADLREKGCRV